MVSDTGSSGICPGIVSDDHGPERDASIRCQRLRGSWPATDEDITIGAADTSKTIETVNVSAGDTVKKSATLLTFTDGTTFDAPAAGTITKVNVYAGNRVTVGRAVMHLTNYSDLNTVVQIDELGIPKIKVGQNVSVMVNAYPPSKIWK